MTTRSTIRRLVSGGQTGVDRAALDVAIQVGLPHGGWCPRGRRAEDGTLDDRYQLRETRSEDYAGRTELNVRDSDATLIINVGSLEGGTALTAAIARRRGKPLLIIEPSDRADIRAIHDWLGRNRVQVLNVAGPRESRSPGIYLKSRSLLARLLDEDPGTDKS